MKEKIINIFNNDIFRQVSLYLLFAVYSFFAVALYTENKFFGIFTFIIGVILLPFIRNFIFKKISKLLSTIITIIVLFATLKFSVYMINTQKNQERLQENIALLNKTIENNNSNIQKESEKNNTTTTKNYGLNEDWIVNGQWKLKITNVATTSQRNQFSNDAPAQVVIITYTYENLGYTGNIQDLYITPYQVIDENKKIAKTYPINYNYPKPAPIGAVMEDAQAAYGLLTESKTIRINFEMYDSTSKKQKASFEVPVS